MLQHKLNLAGHLPVIIFNICAKKKISCKIEGFVKKLGSTTLCNALNEAGLEGTKKYSVFGKQMDQIRGEGLTEENQTEICTEGCALLHRFLCILIKGVKMKIQK